ncbi:MAG: hypothetical protein V3U93_00010 [Alphaproteobacteria bacterium]
MDEVYDGGGNQTWSNFVILTRTTPEGMFEVRSRERRFRWTSTLWNRTCVRLGKAD